MKPGHIESNGLSGEMVYHQLPRFHVTIEKRELPRGAASLEIDRGQDHVAVAIPGSVGVGLRTHGSPSPASIDGQLSASFISFIPAGSRLAIRLTADAGHAVIAAVPKMMMHAACAPATGATWRAAHNEIQLKVSSALQLLAHHIDPPQAEIRLLLDRLLARTLASRFGGLRFRSDDAWLSPQALLRVSSRAAAACGRIDLKAMAAEAGLSVSAFSRAFRGATGLTPGDWLLEERIRTAERLLVDTDMTMAEVAANAGMSSAAHLGQLFRSRRATTPGAYRVRSRYKSP